MDIKKLQNNYTTLEQSRRLLKLDVPADSADCYYQFLKGYNEFIGPIVFAENDSFTINQNSFPDDEIIPCWSVGRLLEIWEICGNGGRCVTVKKGQSRIESLVKLYEENALYAEFSNLEE